MPNSQNALFLWRFCPLRTRNGLFTQASLRVAGAAVLFAAEILSYCAHPDLAVLRECRRRRYVMRELLLDSVPAIEVVPHRWSWRISYHALHGRRICKMDRNGRRRICKRPKRSLGAGFAKRWGSLRAGLSPRVVFGFATVCCPGRGSGAGMASQTIRTTNAPIAAQHLAEKNALPR
jgi:hypothetical protein